MSLHDKHMLSSLSLCKDKEVFSSNIGGKLQINVCFCIVRKKYVALEHDTPSPLCLDSEIHLALNWSCHIEILQTCFWSYF